MIEQVLNLNQRSVSSIMTSRHDIERINLSAPEEEIRSLVEKISTPVWWSPAGKIMKICWGGACIDLLQQSLRQEPLDLQALVRQPLVFPEWPAASRRSSSSARPAPILPCGR